MRDREESSRMCKSPTNTKVNTEYRIKTHWDVLYVHYFFTMFKFLSK